MWTVEIWKPRKDVPFRLKFTAKNDATEAVEVLIRSRSVLSVILFSPNGDFIGQRDGGAS